MKSNYPSAARSLDRHYNFIKGRIAEAIVERLFISVNMIPVHNGYEIKHPDIAHLRRTGQLPKEALRRIEFGSDFLVRSTQKNKDGQFDIYQVEVKFSKSGEIEFDKFDFYDNEDLIFILLDYNGFWCVTKKELNDMAKEEKPRKIRFTDLCPLQDHPCFPFTPEDKETVKNFAYFIGATLQEIRESSEVRKQLSELYNKGVSP